MFKLLARTRLWIPAIPFALIFFGAAANQAVFIANHDTFPVMMNLRSEIRTATPPVLPGAPEMVDDNHAVMSNTSRLRFLADIFDFGDGRYSVGDLLIEAGEWLRPFLLFLWVFWAASKINDRSSVLD